MMAAAKNPIFRSLGRLQFVRRFGEAKDARGTNANELEKTNKAEGRLGE